MVKAALLPPKNWAAAKGWRWRNNKRVVISPSLLSPPHLPAELWINIFEYFDVVTLCVVFPLVCSWWKSLAMHPSLWRRLAAHYDLTSQTTHRSVLRSLSMQCVTLFSHYTPGADPYRSDHSYGLHETVRHFKRRMAIGGFVKLGKPVAPHLFSLARYDDDYPYTKELPYDEFMRNIGAGGLCVILAVSREH